MPSGASPVLQLPGNSWVQAYCRWVVFRPRLVLVLSLIVVSVLSLGLRSLSFNPDMRVFFGDSNAHSQDLAEFENVYGRASNIVFILTPASGEIFTPDVLTAIEELTTASWQTPYSTRVESLANHDRSYARDDEIAIEPLYENAIALSDVELATIRDHALTNSEITNYLVNPEGRVAGVHVRIMKPDNNPAAIAEVMDFTRQLREKFEAEYPAIDIRISGGIAGDHAFDEAGQRDIVTLVPIMLLVIIASLLIGFRDISATIATCLVILLAVSSTIGLASWAGVALTAGSGGTPVIVMTLCIADCVHLISGYSQARASGLAKTEALRAGLHSNFTPIFVTSLTTAIGFLTLNWSESPPLQDLGNMVALGVSIAFLISVSFLPAFLALAPTPRTVRPMRGQALAAWVARLSLGHGRAILLVYPLLLVGSAAGILHIILEDDFVGYFDESYEFRRDTDYFQRELSGLHVLHFSLSAGEEYGVARPEYLNKITAFADWYRAQPTVSQVSDVTAVIMRLNMNMHGDDPAYEVIPESRDQAAQLLLFYELSVPIGRDLNAQINVSKSASRLSVWLRDASSRDIRQLAEAGEAWLRDNAPEMASPAIGLSVVYAHITEANIRAMIRSTVVALLIISGILFLVLRSVRLGLVSLVPNLVPAAMAFGLWGYIFGEVNLAVSVVGAITLGIIVDDTVHLLIKYQRARRERPDEPADVVLLSSFSAVGLALIHTSVALMLGFLVLASSGFAISSDMGALSAIVILMALLADLIFLPPLILLLEKKT